VADRKVQLDRTAGAVQWLLAEVGYDLANLIDTAT
jgi:hypothetical protein